MMKLHNLVDNRELAIHLLSYWGYDEERSEVLSQFRISANAVYPFYRDGKLHFLRFSPLAEKSLLTLEAELDYLHYLAAQGFGVALLLVAQNGKEIIEASTPWGDYLAVVFRKAEGVRADRVSHSDAFFYGYGKALGQLHCLSKNFQPRLSKRDTWEDKLAWCVACLQKCAAAEKMLFEAKQLMQDLAKLPLDRDCYGLVHYDYELDNVFYDDARQTYSVIDFDDAHYHWYGMDIVGSLDNLDEELEQGLAEKAKQSFLEGYDSCGCKSRELMLHADIFRRYAALFKYTRCLRAIYNQDEDLQPWMGKLREHLRSLITEIEDAEV